MVYIDDFAGCDASEAVANEGFQALLDITEALGIEMAVNKCFRPSQLVEWLGYRIDTLDMSICIPPAKLEEVIHACDTFLAADAATKRELQSLAGKLTHIGKCVAGSRRFMARLLEAIRSTQPGTSYIIQDPVKADVHWFSSFARDCNVLYFSAPSEVRSWPIECDSSMLGGGSIFPNRILLRGI